MSTTDNLQSAFAGESQANRKYLAFAKKAEADGIPQVAKLFRAAAAAETVHAHAHLRALDGIKGTEQNLQAAIGGETREEALVHIENAILMILKEMASNGVPPPPDQMTPYGVALTIETEVGGATA